MDPETENEFKHVHEKLKQFERDSRTVIVLDQGFKFLSESFRQLGKKVDKQTFMVGTVGLGIIADLITRLMEIHK